MEIIQWINVSVNSNVYPEPLPVSILFFTWISGGGDGKDIEDITWPRGDKKFIFECWKIFHEWAQRTSEIFATREDKFRISVRPCNFPFII